MDPQAEQDALEAIKNDCRTPRRSLDKTHLQMESIVIKQAERVSEARKTSQEIDDINLIHTTKVHRDDNNTIWVATVQDGLIWDSMEGDFVSSRLRQPTRPTTPIVTTVTAKPTADRQTTNTTEAHEHVEDSDDDDTILVLSEKTRVEPQKNSKKQQTTNNKQRSSDTF